MAFDPDRLINISDEDRARLTDDIGKETITDVQAHIAELGKRAQNGDDVALTRLTASAAASLSVALLQHIGRLEHEDPNGAEHRATMALLPGIRSVVIIAALQAAIVAYSELPPSDDTPENNARHLTRLTRQLHIAQSIASSIWQEVRDFVRVPHHEVGYQKSANGGDIYVVPMRK